MKRPLFILIFILLLTQSSLAEIKTSIFPNPTSQGKTLFVVVDGENISKINGKFMNKNIDFFTNGSDFEAILPVPLNSKVGGHTLYIMAEMVDGAEESVKNVIQVNKGQFKTSKYYLKPKKKKLLRSDWIAEDWVPIDKILEKISPIRIWNGKFMKPCRGWITQGFGVITIINGKRSGQHKGMDIAVGPALAIKTSILAANNGRVEFAEKTRVFGNTIVIDHGQGVHTLYFHLSSIEANVGEIVKKGGVIGKMGNTGISTNPHLHFGMSVRNNRVDPMQWLGNNNNE